MFAAMFRDAWRQTRDQKIQWLVYLAIVLICAILGALPLRWLVGSSLTRGMSLIASSPAEQNLILWAFVKNYVTNWIGGFFGVILSIVVTAGNLPGMLRPGTIDLMLSYPHARWKLLLAKSLAAVVFISWYTALLIGGVYVVAGVRGGGWDAKFLLSIPAMILLFCTLYSISMLAAVVYRNSVVVILTTLGVWLLASFLNGFMGRLYDLSEQRYGEVNAAAFAPVENNALQFYAWNRLHRAEQRQGTAGKNAPGGGGAPVPEDDEDSAANAGLKTREAIYADAADYEWWGDVFRVATFVLPKTQVFRTVFENLAIQIDTRNKLLSTLEAGFKRLFQSGGALPAPRDEWDRLAVERATAVAGKAGTDYTRDGLITAGFTAAMVLLSCLVFSRSDY